MRPFQKGFPMAYTLDQIKAFAANPNTIPSAGAYGEGKVYTTADILTSMKGLVQQGQLTIGDYLNLADPLVNFAQQQTANISRGGSKQASAVNPAWQSILNAGAAKVVDGQIEAAAPFTAREYAQLPVSVLPTQTQVNSGVIPVNLLPPIQRFAPDPTPTNGPGSVVQPGVPGSPATPLTPGQNGGPATTPGGGVVIPVPGTAPAPVPPGTPAPTDVNAPQPGVAPAPTPTAPGVLQPTTIVPGSTPPPYTPGAPVTGVIDPTTGQPIGVPVVGDPLANSVPKQADQSTIEQEGLREEEQDRQAYEATNALQTSNLQSLQSLLTAQDNNQFNVDSPGIYESLNANGLLRSSGLGEALARERSKLSTASDQQIAQQALAYSNADVGQIQDILNKTQAFQQSGLERNFTLADYNNEVATAKSLGSTTAPTIAPSGSVLGGVLSGATAGGTIGATAGGPVAAGVGAVLGGVAGGANSSKS